jgi:hypothetical protein
VAIGLWVNGTGQGLDFDARTRLLDLLREHLGLTGTEKGCNRWLSPDLAGVMLPITPGKLLGTAL